MGFYDGKRESGGQRSFEVILYLCDKPSSSPAVDFMQHLVALVKSKQPSSSLSPRGQRLTGGSRQFSATAVEKSRPF